MKIVLDLQACQSQGSYYRGIGRYARAFTQALVRQAKAHEVHILTNAALPYYAQEIRSDFANFLPSDNIHAFSIPTPAKGLEYSNNWRMRVAEYLREYAALQLQADIFQVSSLFEGMGDDIVTSVDHPILSANTAITLHDLIPLVSPGEYWSEPTRQSWYFRKLQSLKNAGLHLAVSEFSRQEAIERLSLDPAKVFTVYNAISADFKVLSFDNTQKQALFHKFSIKKPFIMYAGGIESRKNVDFLLKAYAELPSSLRQQYQLVIAGELQEWQRQFLRKAAKECSIHDLCITGLLTDDDLIALYNLAELFVFPSLYEGFGLPVLEAMACGTPTLCADNTSLPEVRGWKDALFNASQLDSLGSKLHQALTDSHFRSTLREQGLRQAQKFSWDTSASQAIAIFEEHHERQLSQQRVCKEGGATKPRLACVLTTNDAQVSQYAAWLMPALANQYQIEYILENSKITDAWGQANFPCSTWQWMRENPDYYQRCIYILGEESFSQELLMMSQAQPGVYIWLASVLPPLSTESVMQYLATGYKALLFTSSNQDALSLPDLLSNNILGVLVRNAEMLEQFQHLYGVEYTQHWRALSNNEQQNNSFCAGRSTGDVIHQYVESRYNKHPLVYEQILLNNIRELRTSVEPDTQDWLRAAECIAANRLSTQNGKQLRNLFYDVSVLAHIDNASGIHRATRNILLELFKSPPAGFRVEPVYAQNGRYLYARQFTCHLLELDNLPLLDEVVEFQADDVLLVVDLGLDFAVDMESYLQYLRAKGLQLYYLVHDILAVKLPKAYFDDGIYRLMPRWIGAISRMADGLICTTQAVKQDLQEWLSEHPPQRPVPLRLGVCPLGAELQVVSSFSEALDQTQQALLDQLVQYPTVLMVSTVEPRKGYAQALDAFELLWAQGEQIQLVIVGKCGWNVDALVGRLQQHPEQGKRLYWLNSVSDTLLAALYRQATVLLMASEGEGFGLPLIEAAQYGLPVIARGIPVFRELGGDHAFYFDGLAAQPLANTIQQWFILATESKAPKPEGIRWLTWKESTECIKTFMLQGDIYQPYPKPNVFEA